MTLDMTAPTETNGTGAPQQAPCCPTADRRGADNGWKRRNVREHEKQAVIGPASSAPAEVVALDEGTSAMKAYPTIERSQIATCRPICQAVKNAPDWKTHAQPVIPFPQPELT
jgi:hypothetical protein